MLYDITPLLEIVNVENIPKTIVINLLAFRGLCFVLNFTLFLILCVPYFGMYVVLVMQLLRRFRANVLTLVEPKISGEQADRTCRHLGFNNWHCQEAEGLSCDLWLFWNQTFVCIEVLRSSQQYLHCKAKDNNNKTFLATGF